MNDVLSFLQRPIHCTQRIDVRSCRWKRASIGMSIIACCVFIAWNALAALVVGQTTSVVPDAELKEAPDVKDGAIDRRQWGSLRGRIIYRGDLTSRAATRLPNGIVVTDESLVVDKATRELANVVVCLVVKPTDKPLQIHPQLQAQAKRQATIQLLNDRIVPHVTLLHTGQSVRWKNDQSAGDDLMINSPIEPVSFLLMPGESVVHRFEHETRVPLSCESTIHSWLTAVVVVRSNPYVAVTDPRGEFVIANVPRGNWTFQWWHERLGWLSHVRIGGQDKKLSRGMMDVEIDQETCDLGGLEITPAT